MGVLNCDVYYFFTKILGDVRVFYFSRKCNELYTVRISSVVIELVVAMA